MDELLAKLKIKSVKNGVFIGYTLIIECDESGFIIDNIYESDIENPVFEFNKLSELYEWLE